MSDTLYLLKAIPSCLLGIPNCSEWQWLSVARPRFLSLLGLVGLVTKYVSKPIHKPWGQDIGIAIVFLIWGLDQDFQSMFLLKKVEWWKVIAKGNFKKQHQEQFQQDSYKCSHKKMFKLCNFIFHVLQERVALAISVAGLDRAKEHDCTHFATFL